jgi:hypothetical protein
MALRRSRPKTGVQTMSHLRIQFVGELHTLDYGLVKQYARSVSQFCAQGAPTSRPGSH